MSLIQKCRYFRVPFKRGSTVVVKIISANCMFWELDIALALVSRQSDSSQLAV